MTAIRRLSNGNVRHDNAVLIQTIGDRMRQARELCNLSQAEAAKRLGYQNSSKLSKVENATNSKTVPLWLILKAATVYEVSIDFLFGLSGDWDAGVRMTRERETSAWLFEQWEQSRQRDMKIIRQLNDRLETIDGAVQTCIDQAFDVDDALNKVIYMNADTYEEIAGLSRLISSVRRLLDAAKESRARMKRFHMERQLAGKDLNGQMELFTSGENDGKTSEANS